jgi:hypothetical protein
MHEFFCLGFYRIHHVGVLMAYVAHRNPGNQIQITVTMYVEQVIPFGPNNV